MIRAIQHSISRKLMAVVLATTFVALLMATLALLAHDARTYQRLAVADLTTQADIFARVSGPSLAFNDFKTASENLAILGKRPQILAAALYTPDRRQFAVYALREDIKNIPQYAGKSGYKIENGRISLFHPVMENGVLTGIVYLQARHMLAERLQSTLLILAAVMASSFLLAALISGWLQASITRPVLAVTKVARQIMQGRDFSLRAKKTSSDEIGVLVDAFNGMLSEVDQRTRELEATNRALEVEMKERRQAEEALLLADRRKDEFLATLAHELRNPLAPLVNGLEIQRMPECTPTMALQARAIMERQLDQMVRLVDDLLDVSRITTGKLVIRRETVVLQDVMQHAIETVTRLIDYRGHVLGLELPSHPILIEGDSTRLAQVFSNLLTNAAKYTNDGGQILLQALVKQGSVEVRLRDNGIGISATMQQQVFAMFSQADHSLERAHAGLGVGLTLARHLIELHEGRISLESDGEGAGSTFIVELPLSAAQPAVDQPIKAFPARTKQRRLLLVDDNRDFIDGMAALLRESGHEVRVAYDGQAGLEAATVFMPDAALLDIGLPGLNGYALARELKRTPATHDVFLIAVTGWGQEKDRLLAREAGFDRHLVKPVRLPQVLALLDELALSKH